MRLFLLPFLLVLTVPANAHMTEEMEEMLLAASLLAEGHASAFRGCEMKELSIKKCREMWVRVYNIISLEKTDELDKVWCPLWKSYTEDDLPVEFQVGLKIMSIMVDFRKICN